MRIRLCLWVGLLLMIATTALAQDTPTTPVVPVVPVLPESTEEANIPSIEPAQVPTTSTNGVVDPDLGTGEDTDAGVPEAPATGPTCPTLVQEAFTATQLICENVASGQTCIGNGIIEATGGGDNLAFAVPGDTTTFANLDELTLRTSGTENSIWTVVTTQIELNTTDGDVETTGTMLMFGDVTITNAGEVTSASALPATVLAQFGMNVRRTPDTDGVVVWQLQAGEEVLATGRTADSQWIRIEIPSRFGGPGWVYAPFLDVSGGAQNLPLATGSSPPPQLEAPEFGSMQDFTFSSQPIDPSCPTTIPDSGIILQSPSGLPDRLKLRANDVRIELNGTIYMTAQAGQTMQISVLEGDAVITTGGATQTISSGERANIALGENLSASSAPNIVNANLSELTNLPIRLLDRQFSVGGTDGPVIETGAAEATATPGAESTDDPISSTIAEPTATTPCTLTAEETVRNIRLGPGTTFDVVSVLEPGQSVIANAQTTDEFSLAWYQTENGWIRFDTVNVSGDCSSLPQATNIPTPPAPAATGTPEAAANSLTSSQLGELCGRDALTQSESSDGETFAINIGGNWSATAETTVRYSAVGGLLRGEWGDYIRITDTAGNILAQSGNNQALEYTFTQDTDFTVAFSAANGDIVIMRAECVAASEQQ